jgi:hypothetical protein
MRLRFAALVSLIPLLGGCALYYVDEHGATHVYGVGHLAMRAVAPEEGKKAVLEEMTLFGVAAGIRAAQPSLSVGFDSQQRMTILDENTAVRVDWPSADFLGVRVGASPLAPLQEPAGAASEEGSAK